MNPVQLSRSFAYDPADTKEIRTEKLAIFLVSFSCSAAGLVWSGMYFLVFGLTFVAFLPLLFTLLVGTSLLVSHITKNHRFVTHAQIACIVYVTALIQWSIGGVFDSGFVAAWAFLGPITALMFLSLRQSALWFFLFLLNVMISAVFEDQFAARGLAVSKDQRIVFFAMNIGVSSFVVFVFARYFVSSALAEREKANGLLLNILPEKVARELKDTGQARTHSFADVSVMFTDFKGFTNVAEQLTAEDLVQELDTCFRRFDSIISDHGIEKIKTIGDAYMCAGGLPEVNHTHAIDCTLAGLAMQDFMQREKLERESQGKPGWEMRLGIHTGPLVSGVVGLKKFAYDVWGDSVNIASRIESSGSAAKVNISRSTYEKVRFLFDCEARGQVPAKNKGVIDMYFVNGIKPAFSENREGKIPNHRFREIYGKIESGARLVAKPR